VNGPPAEVAAVRTAVRRALSAAGCVEETPVLVACSGGADSLALAAAAAFLAKGAAFGAVVDHGLQDGSAARAQETAALLERLGLPTRVLPVTVAGPGGTEAAARRARYAALLAARPSPDSPVLLGHTLDDQAETVLLGLGRGSGARSLAGMAVWNPPWLRPLLGLRRATTRAACAAQDLPVWDDPHNTEPRFTRVRLRHEVLPLLEEVLSGGVAEALARTAAQLADDGAALDLQAATVRAAAERRAATGTATGTATAEAGPGADTGTGSELDVSTLAAHHPAVRRRVLRSWLLDAGVGELTDQRLRDADDLVGRWRGQGAVALSGGIALARRGDRLVLGRQPRPARTSVGGSTPPGAHA
jgi:tRNA(Ile)-lysidine synthase